MNRYRAKFVFLCCLLASFGCVYGQGDKQPVEVTKRKALVGPYCMVNQLSGVIHALTAYYNLDYITDADLNNYASVTGVNVNATLTPILSVKDNQCIYKGGTTAGFSLVSTSGGGLLSLDVIKLFSISTYLDGKLVETRAVKEATSGGVGLNLIKIPGSDAVSIDVSIETTEGKNFDEIYLMIGGVQVEALQKMSIKYAFVGEPKEVFLTYNGVKNYGKEVGTPIEIDYDKCSGMPWPVKDRPIREDTFHDKLFDDDLTNSLGTGGLAIGEWFHAQIGTTYQFEAGTEVGFKYYNKGLLDLSLGSFVTIKLYDEHNKVVQTETVSAGLLGLGVIETGETITSITSKVPFYSARLTVGAGALSVNVGGVGIYYGFVREKPVTYHYCPIQSSMDAAICNQETTFTLMSNPKVNVEWKLESYQPYVSNTPIEEVMKRVVIGKTENGVTPVTGLSNDGVYTFKSTALDCTSEPKCTETVVLRKGDPSATTSCGMPLVNEGEQLTYELSTSGHGTSGSLISISDVKMKGNVLDDNLTNYASYVSGLSIASNLGIIGVKTVDESPIGTDIKGDKRVGFIVENASTFLDADALQFLRIRFFRKGKEVYDSVIDESNAVGVGLIGSDHAQKIRYSTKIQGNIEFDEIQLWTSGVLNLGLNTLRIYHAFIESADENCSDPLRDGCSMIVSTKSMNASLSYKIPFELATVAGTVVNGFHLLDDDMNTKMTYVPTVNLGGGFVLCIKLGRTIDKTKQLGLVLDNIPHLAGAGLADWMTVSTYLNGQATDDTFSDWETLGLDVIGYGDRRYVISQPTQSYDEVRITFAGVLEAVKDYNLYGLFFRSDLDGDGLPDCLDPECCSGSLTNLLVTQHLCEGDVVELLGQAKYEKENQRTFKYSIFQEDADINTATPVFSGEMVINKGIFQQTVWTDTKSGKYKLVIYDTNEEGSEYVLTTLFFIVHPLETTWSATTTDTDWNTWENWSNGSPWLCTNVIIPEQANVYPILKENAENGCNFIHFEANAEVKNTHNLDYQKAWVEMKLRPNRYYMVAAPLKKLYSGDWFITAGGQQPPYFVSLVENNYPENRVTPTIYQRLWDATSLDQLISAANRPYVKPGDKVDVAVTGWTKPFNWLATSYDKNLLNGQEFDFNALSVWVHPRKPTEKEDGENGQTYTFRFPKEHEEYHYYDENGRLLSVGAQMSDRKNCGRFIYEREDGRTGFPIVMRFKNNSFNNKTFLVGNPFMTHINVEKLLRANTHISSVKLYDAETGAANSLIYDLNGDGILAAIPGDNAGTLHSIAPMQSFFVTCSAERLESCAVTFTEDMLETQSETKQTIASRQYDCSFSIDEHLIRLSASAGKHRAEALIYFTGEASECYREHEDAEILLEQGMNPSIALFSIAEQHALDVEQRDKGGEIPLGLCLAKPEKVTLKITVPAGYPDWLLTDSQTKRVYPLFSGKTNEVELGCLTTNIGRFYLKGQVDISTPDAVDDMQHRAVCYWDEGGTRMVVQSEGEQMERCEVFSVDGRMVAQTASAAAAYSFSLKEGLYVVKILFDDGTVVSKKII